jgi:beta-glucosidase
VAPNHLGDRPSLDLSGCEEDLARAILGIGKPRVAVLLNGRPPSINQLAGQAGAGATLECLYLGQQGGAAVAATLFGHLNGRGYLFDHLGLDVGNFVVVVDHSAILCSPWTSDWCDGDLSLSRWS